MISEINDIFVNCKGYIFDEFYVQVSILGPPFFDEYINDIINEPQAKYKLHADGLKIYPIINGPTDYPIVLELPYRVNTWSAKYNLLFYKTRDSFRIQTR